MADYNKDLYQKHLYKVWANMKQRCSNPKNISWSRYGGRGIMVCKEWDSFVKFYEDMASSCKPGLTLDRINNDGNYSKENCKWSTSKEQAGNTRNIKQAYKISYMGITDTIANWAKYLGVNRTTLSQRLQGYGWSTEKALGITQ